MVAGVVVLAVLAICSPGSWCAEPLSSTPSSLDKSTDNQTMTAVLDSRRAFLAAANSSQPQEEPVGDGDEIQPCTLEDLGDVGDLEDPGTGPEARGRSGDAQPTNHRATVRCRDRHSAKRTVSGDNKAAASGTNFTPSPEISTGADSYGFDVPTRHIHFHQHHMPADITEQHSAHPTHGSHSSHGSHPRRPTLAQSPGLSHYRVGSSPSASSVVLNDAGHRNPILYKPVKFESEPHHSHAGSLAGGSAEVASYGIHDASTSSVATAPGEDVGADSGQVSGATYNLADAHHSSYETQQETSGEESAGAAGYSVHHHSGLGGEAVALGLQNAGLHSQDLHHGLHQGLQHYSVHEQQHHDHQLHNHLALHTAIASAQPLHSEASAETHGSQHSHGSAGAAGQGGDFGGDLGGELGGHYPSIGAVPYESPKVVPPATVPLFYGHSHHKPKDLHHDLFSDLKGHHKDLHKGKHGSSGWKHALRVIAGLAPLALLVAAFQPSILVLDPRQGTRQRSTDAVQHCEERAVCEVARATGPQALQALLLGTPASASDTVELESISQAAQANACSKFACDQYDVRFNVTQAAQPPARPLDAVPSSSSSSSSSSIESTTTVPSAAPVRVVKVIRKERKRKKFVNSHLANDTTTPTTITTPIP